MNQSNSVFVAALILAGGKSSRMGEDKALIPWDGTPMLTRVFQVAAECCQQVYILTPWPEKYQTIVPESEFLLESNPGQGPLIGLAEGLRQIPAEWVLLLACDMPLLQASILQNWINTLTQVPTETLALVPRREERWEPLCAFYRHSSLSNLHKFIQQGGRSFQSWLNQVSVQPLSVSQESKDMLWNCNTPFDLAKPR